VFLWFMNRRFRVLVVCVFASANCTAGRTPLEHRMSLRAFINSPTGPKTTHFWGPVANWGFVVAVRPSINARVGFD